MPEIGKILQCKLERSIPEDLYAVNVMKGDTTIHPGIGAESYPGCFSCGLFRSLSNVHECSGVLQMASSPLEKQTVGGDSPHERLMNLAMDLASLCDV